MSEPYQVECRCQSGRTGANNRHPFTSRRRIFGERSANDGLVAHIGQFVPVLVSPVGYESLKPHDIYRLVIFATAAGIFTAVIAYPPTHTGEGVFTAYSPICIRIPFISDQCDIALGTLVGWAGIPAWGNPFLLDCITTGHRLGREAISSFPLAQVQVERIVDANWAHIGAVATSGTLGLINIACLAPHPYLIIANETRDGLDFTIAQQIDVLVASDGHHFGCEYSSRTVQGWEGFIKLGHMPTDAWLTLDQIDLFPSTG